MQGENSLGQLLSSGLSGGVAPSLPPNVSSVTLGTIHSIITDSITHGVKWAAFTAGIFVSFGALSSFLIPSPKQVVKQETRVAAITVTRSRSVNLPGVAFLAEFALIEILLFGLSADYSANQYMREWFSQNAWPLGFLLGDFLSPVLGATVGVLGYIAYRLSKREVQKEELVERIPQLAVAA